MLYISFLREDVVVYCCVDERIMCMLTFFVNFMFLQVEILFFFKGGYVPQMQQGYYGSQGQAPSAPTVQPSAPGKVKILLC